MVKVSSGNGDIYIANLMDFFFFNLQDNRYLCS